MLLALSDFLGRFHPVLVHLPIGILVLACLFQWLLLKNRFANLAPSIPIMLFWGMLAAIASCITGYFLSMSGDYEGALVDRHQWMGIVTAILAVLLYVLHRFFINESIARWVSLVLLALVAITGHLGGSLTHGKNYLTEGLNVGDDGNGTAIKPIPDIQNAALYADVVQPILQARCYGCHGPNKQKGKLRLDQPDHIMKGGEEGKVIEPGKAEESELIERLLLSIDDDDHMPPREKPQLTQAEINILHWWVSTGSDFKKKVNELPQTDKVKPALQALESGNTTSTEKKPRDIPEGNVTAADESLLSRLKNAGVIILPVAQNSNYLSASFFTAGSGADSLVRMLEPLRKQLVWLKLDNAAITDATMDAISQLTSLTRLQLVNTPVTDAGIGKLKTLTQLQSLNLVGTKVTLQGLNNLKSLAGLKNLYLYHTGVTATDWNTVQQLFPAAQIDSGKYVVPTLITDTTVIKY